MTFVAEPMPATPAGSAYDPVLRWMIFTGVSVFAAVALWRYGLIRLMVASDRTYISSVIAALYVVASASALARAVALSREAAAAARLVDLAPAALAGGVAKAPRGRVGDHARDLVAKARAGASGARLDQTLLLRALAQRLHGGAAFGALASDSLLKLGLLGTIIGFILMLGPVAGLDAENEAAVRAAMGVMSDGMAVAMYTTLAGLVGSILLRAQYFMLETATAEVFWSVVRWSETRFIPALERAYV